LPVPGSTRRACREVALKALYEIEIGRQPFDDAIRHAFEDEAMAPSAGAFAEDLVKGVMDKKEEIDAKLAALSHEWALERQACIDRNAMRIAAYELLYCPSTPPAVVINEAVELVKKFSTNESGRFVNGVLGALADSLALERAI
jgi:N utilization substance protein B